MAGAYPEGMEEPMEIDDAPKPPPLKKKPILGNKPKKEAEEDKEDQPKRAFGEKPAHLKKETAAPLKALTGPKIEDENLGAGLGKEQATEKVKETFPPEIIGKMEEAKWQDKVAGLQELTQVIIETQPSADVIEAVIKWLKSNLKEWKDSNMNMIKGSLALISGTSKECDTFSKRTVQVTMPFLIEKNGDIKYSAASQESMLNFAEQVGPKFVMFQLMKLTNGHKAPKVVQEACKFMTKAIDEFSIIGMPIKEMIEYFLVCVSH
jgi:hypothetical protein